MREFVRTPVKPRIANLWVVQVRSGLCKAAVILDAQTAEEAMDMLPTQDKLYSETRLKEIDYKVERGTKIIKQSWLSKGKTVYLDFYLSRSFYNVDDARSFVLQSTQKFKSNT